VEFQQFQRFSQLYENSFEVLLGGLVHQTNVLLYSFMEVWLYYYLLVIIFLTLSISTENGRLLHFGMKNKTNSMYLQLSVIILGGHTSMFEAPLRKVS